MKWCPGIAARVREARSNAALTQQALAELTGVSAAYVSMIERGSREKIGDPLARHLASVLSVRLEWLTTGEGERSALRAECPECHRLKARMESLIKELRKFVS